MTVLEHRIGNMALTQPPGGALAPGLRADMEAGFGHDFSSVRVRSDSEAAREARALGTQAFTRGQEIVFGEPLSVGLLAHELAHVVQQRRGGGLAGQAHEAEAAAAATTVEHGGRAEVVLGSASGHLQRAGPPTVVPPPPAWLSGLNATHVEGNIWEVTFKTGGPHYVGPYNELDAYRKKTGLSSHAHHIVGGEHLLDLKSSFRYENAPAVLIEPGLHEKVISPWITREQREVGGRRGGRPVLIQTDVKLIYRDVYRRRTPLRELSRIADNIIDQSTPPTPPGLLAKSVTGTAQETPAVGAGGKAAVAAEKQLVAGEHSVSGIKPQVVAAEEKLLAKAGQVEAQVADKPPLQGMGLKGGPSPIKLAVAGVGIQIAGSLLQSWMYDKIRTSVLNMPKPTVESARIWSDDASRAKYIPVELLVARLPEAYEDLLLSQARNSVHLVAFWRNLELAPPEQRQEMLIELEGLVYRSQANVLKARSNVARALELEPLILESVQAAAEVQEMVENPTLFAAAVSFVGFDPLDLLKISDNLRWFQASYKRSVLAPLHGLQLALARAEASNDEVLAQIREIGARTVVRVARPR